MSAGPVAQTRRLTARLLTAGHCGLLLVLLSCGAAYEAITSRQAARRDRVPGPIVYDRAGYGYSEPGLGPRTSQRITEKLHTPLYESSPRTAGSGSGIDPVSPFPR